MGRLFDREQPRKTPTKRKPEKTAGEATGFSHYSNKGAVNKWETF